MELWSANVRARATNGVDKENRLDRNTDNNREERTRKRRWAWPETLRRVMSGRSRRTVYYLVTPLLAVLAWCSVMYITSHRGEGQIRRWEEHFIDEHFKNGEDHLDEGEDDDVENKIKAYSDAGIKLHKDPELPVQLPKGAFLNVAISIPFLDHNPLSAIEYIQLLEWITIYSTVNIRFHVITNEESKEYVDKIMEKVNLTSNCKFDTVLLSLDDLIEEAHNRICPDLKASEEYCNLLIAKMTPLLFPFYFPNLPYIIYIDKHITFHDDVGKLYNTFTRLEENTALAMVQEQSLRYMRSFGTYHMKAPGTKLGLPPSKGHPGYNPDLLLMDLAKLRSYSSYKAMLSELKLTLLLRKYSYHPQEDMPEMGDVLNLMAAEQPQMFHQLSCEWNRSAHQIADKLHEEFLDCVPAESPFKARASNKNPNLHPKPKESGTLDRRDYF